MIEDQPNLKLETLIECKDSNDFVEHKKKFQIFKNIKSTNKQVVFMINIYNWLKNLYILIKLTKNIIELTLLWVNHIPKPYRTLKYNRKKPVKTSREFWIMKLI